MENTEEHEVQLDAATSCSRASQAPTSSCRTSNEGRGGAVIYVTGMEPLSADQIATALQQPAAEGQVLEELTAEYNKRKVWNNDREVAGG